MAKLTTEQLNGMEQGFTTEQLDVMESAPQIEIDPKVLAKKRTSEVFGTIFGLDEPTTIATYDNLAENMYGTTNPSKIQEMMEEDGFQISPERDGKDVVDFSTSMLERKESPKTAERQRMEADRQMYNVFRSLQLADDIIFDPENRWYREKIATKPTAKEGVLYSEPIHDTEDLLDFDTYVSLLEQSATQENVESLRNERKALLAKMSNEAAEQNSDYYDTLEWGEFSTGSKVQDVTLEVAKGLLTAVKTIERGAWSTSIAMGMAWNQPSLDAVEEQLKDAKLTPIKAAGKIGYVTRAMAEAIPNFAYNMTVGTAGIFITEYGNARQDALDDGATDIEADVIAIPVATINTIIEGWQIDKIFKLAGMGKGAKQAVKKAIKDRSYKAFLKGGAKFAGQSVKTAINEGIEGAAQEGVSIAVPGFVIGNYPKDENGRIDWSTIMTQVQQSAIGEGLGGLLIGMGGAVYNARNVQNYKHDIALNLITSEGMESKQALEVATNIVERLKNQEGNPKEIYSNEVGKVKNADNRAKAAAHVIKRGKEMSDEQYRKIATDTTGKDSMVDMTYEEGEKFINALNKAKVEIDKVPPISEAVDTSELPPIEEATEQDIHDEVQAIKNDVYVPEKGELAYLQKPVGEAIKPPTVAAKPSKAIEPPITPTEGTTAIKTSIGNIEIPTEDLDIKWDEALEVIFDYGNQEAAGKPNQPDLSRSLSMGDTVEYEGKNWLLMPSGWQDVSQLSQEGIDKIVGEAKIPIPAKAQPQEAVRAEGFFSNLNEEVDTAFGSDDLGRLSELDKQGNDLIDSLPEEQKGKAQKLLDNLSVLLFEESQKVQKITGIPVVTPQSRIIVRDEAAAEPTITPTEGGVGVEGGMKRKMTLAEAKAARTQHKKNVKTFSKGDITLRAREVRAVEVLDDYIAKLEQQPTEGQAKPAAEAGEVVEQIKRQREREIAAGKVARGQEVEVFVRGQQQYDVTAGYNLISEETVHIETFDAKAVPQLRSAFIHKDKATIQQADVRKPILLGTIKGESFVIDGHHRVEKAIQEGKSIQGWVLTEKQTKQITSKIGEDFPLTPTPPTAKPVEKKAGIEVKHGWTVEKQGKKWVVKQPDGTIDKSFTNKKEATKFAKASADYVKTQKEITEEVKSHKVDILPHKTELLTEIDAAIKKAPIRGQELEGDDKAVHFEINGGVNVFNDKTALTTFRDKVEAMPATEVWPAKKSRTTKSRGSKENLQNEVELAEKRLNILRDRIVRLKKKITQPMQNAAEDLHGLIPTKEYELLSGMVMQDLEGLEYSTKERIKKDILEAIDLAIKSNKAKLEKPPKTRGRQGGFLDNIPFGNKDKLEERVDEVMSFADEPKKVSEEEKKKSVKELKRTDTITTFTDVATDAIKGIDKAFGIMSTRIKNISQKLFQEVRNKYINPVKMVIADRTKKVHPFVDGIEKRLSESDAYDFEVARWTGDTDTVERIIAEYGLQEEYDDYRLVFDLMYHEGKAVGMDMNYTTAYFPSKVKDLNGLLSELNRREGYAPIVKALTSAQDKKGRPLSKEEQIQVLDTLLRGYRTTSISLTSPGFTRARTLIRDDISLIKYYYGFAETTSRYIESMTENIQARKFFGKQTKEIVQLRANISRQKTNIAKWEKDTEKDRTKNIQNAKDKLQGYEKKLSELDDGTLTASIGGYVKDLIDDGTINYDQQVELRQIFDGLFNTVGSNRWIHTLRSLEYVGSLAQVPALVTQYSEVVLSLLKAPGTTLPNWVRAHLGKAKIKLEDIGVAHIGQEWADADLDKTATSLMKAFEKIDKIGKETFVNSVVDKYRKMAKTNPDKVKEELDKYYPKEDHDAIIESLKSGGIDNNIKGFALNGLADVQPISKMEVPELYAKAGNLRVFYMYKTFTLKRLDIMRNQAYNDIKAGIKTGSRSRVLKGLGKLVWLALMFTLADSSADVVKDVIRGRPIQDVPDYVMDNLLQMILLSKYAANKVPSQGVSVFFRDNIALPVSTIDAAARDLSTLLDEDSEKGSELAKRIPWMGDLYYWYLGEGARKVEEGYYD